MNEMTPTEVDPDTLSLTLQRHIKAPVDRVYAAWLDPATLTRFMSNCQGMSLAAAETDPRVGGRFLLGMNTGSRVIDHRGTYLELVPHSRIAFTWESEYSTIEGSRVTLDLVPEGDGTLLTLTHVRFANADSRDGHSGGWATILDGLVKTNL